jgi:hypothetical protein
VQADLRQHHQRCVVKGWLASQACGLLPAMIRCASIGRALVDQARTVTVTVPDTVSEEAP